MLSIRKRGDMKWGYNHASTLEEGGTIRDTVDMFGPTDLWEPVYAMYEEPVKTALMSPKSIPLPQTSMMV